MNYPPTTDYELFELYKQKVAENARARMPFGEHQRKAFEDTAGLEIERLRYALQTIVSYSKGKFDIPGMKEIHAEAKRVLR